MISLRIPAESAGIHSTNTPINDLKAVTKDEANSGIIPRIPNKITFKAATIDIAAVTVTVASMAKPEAKNCKPTPAAIQPIPIKAIAAATLIIAPITGSRINPARPIIVKAPAIVINPLAIDAQDIPPRVVRTDAIIASEVAATSNAADPLKVPSMAFNPIARIATAPPIATRPLAMPSQLKPERFDKVRPIIEIAAAKRTIWKAPLSTCSLSFDMILAAATSIAVAASSPTPPLANSPQLRPDKL